MAKYRWGFETIENGNPIFTECFPIVEDGTSLDYAQQTNEVFYRAKLNGTITFRFDTFDYIIDAGYNAVHIVVLQRYDETEIGFVEVWRGKFTLTDCTINYDTHTIDVTPETIDRYTAVLDNLEKEYNLVKLKAQIKPVNILVRPCLQIYSLNDAKLTNCVGYNSWEINCDAVGGSDIANYHFIERAEYFAICIQYNNYKSEVAGQRIIYWGIPDWNSGEFYLTGKRWNGTQYVDHTLFCECGNTYEQTHTYFRVYYPNGGGGYESGYFVRADFDFLEAGTTAVVYYSEYAPYTSDATAQWNKVYCRLIAQTELSSITIHQSTYQLYDLTNTDMAGANMNYNKVMEADFIDAVVDGRESAEPTAWGLNYNEKYFEKPADVLLRHYAPAGQDLWKYVSIWWYIDSPSSYNIANDELTATRRIKDCYDYRQTIARLLNKAGVYPDYLISGCLGGTNDYVGTRTDLRITPRSNVISSYYDTPAQNAPISLAKVLNMLKIIYQCYWYIDNNGNFHIEHISFFDNGYSTTEDEPELIVDLESELHTRTLNNKVFGQNQVKFDKQDMPEQYTFGWADSVTRPFIGYPINCLDKYVQQGNISEQNAADFDSDVDYVLSSPNDVSKDGFFLFALPAEGLDYSDTLKVENVLITDEIGDTFEVSIQNADAAFVKIHKTWWRYHLPCENINVNNEDTVALTTGSYKLQTLEFTDTAMADIIGNVDNCNKIIRTQQGDGHVKTLSINLNSLATKADLLFNFVGRWYYLRGTALGASITISVNGESVTIDVSNNTFKYRYKEPIAALDFSGTDVVSVNFADCDNLNNLTSADEMFKNCAELLAVDFANKTFGAVTTANDMFAGCSELTTLICPPTESWKADLDFSDCPNLTIESLDDLINDFLYSYDSGTHTITPNSTMWNALDGAVQDDIIARATAKGWTIAIPAQYSLTGTSAGSVVYATINGAAVEIDVVGGNWSYNYNTPISSIAFTNDTNLQTIDFSLSDGLASLASLDNAFKGCTMLTAVDFTNCDLTNVVSAADCFAACSALFNVTIPANSWKPDVDFNDCALIAYAEMQDIINGLFTYTSGTHTITFNQTTWDALSVAQQQTIFDAAQLKGWTTNAVMVVYAIKGKSTAASESFTLQFIDDNTQAVTTETITCAVDGSGNWEYQYSGKKIYSINQLFFGRNTISQLEFTEELTELTNGASAFNNMPNLTLLSMPNATFDSLTNAYAMFASLPSLLTLDLSKTTFGNLNSAQQMFYNNGATTIDISAATFDNLTNAQEMFNNVIAPLDLSATTFPSLTNAQQMFYNCKATSITLNSATTFANLLISRAMFYGCSNITSLSLPNATFENVTTAQEMINRCTALTTLDLSNATFANATTAFNMFLLTENITNIDLSAATFAALTNASGMFNACYKLQSVDLSAATFTNVTNTDAMFYNDAQLSTIAWNNNLNFGNLQTAGGNGMFYNCKLLTNNYIQKVFSVNLTKLANAQQMLQQCIGITSLDLSNQTFGALTNANNMFNGCSALQTLNLSNATFANLTSAMRMMVSCTALTSIDLSAATFANLTNAQFMFNVLTALPTLSLPNATFEKVTIAQGIFSQYNNAQLTTINVPKATFESLATTANANFFNGNYGNSIVNYTAKPLGVDNKAIGVSFAFYAPRLNYASFLSVANWVKDLSGLSAQTITLSAVAWNALSAAEQNTIDTILSGKNWTRAIA